MSHPPFALHPDNPRYFLFRGQPRVLVCATEHYGSVINRRFDFARYLDDAADKRQTLTRLFLLFRELQTPRNPYSPCKPESPDYVAPWQRTGPGTALDGEPAYDLDRPNPEFFARLRRFLTLASDHGIVVELTLFSNSYADGIWALNPLRAANNVNGVGDVAWQEYTSLADARLVARQLDYVRRVVQETNGFDNVYYEVCNEPGAGIPGHASTADIDAWQQTIARAVRDEEARLPNRHLVFWSQAFRYENGAAKQSLDGSFGHRLFDATNVHPLPDVTFRGRTYGLGRFMGKDLVLSAMRDFCLATAGEAGPCVLDEDNSASLYRDEVGWTIHRKRAWTALLSGCHYDFIDFSIVPGLESGTAASQAGIRAWMRHLSTFIHDVDVVHARPTTEWLDLRIEHGLASGLALPGAAYVAYIADARELDEPGAGEALSGEVRLALPSGRYLLQTFSPTTGLLSPAVAVATGAGDPATVAVPPFVHDVALRARRAD